MPMKENYKINRLIYVLALGTTLLTSCASVGVSRIKEYPSKGQNCQLDVYTDKSEISKPFEVISLIDSRTGTTLLHDRTASSAIEEAKPYACDCGADAVLIETTDTEGIGFNSWGQGKA